MTIKCWDWDKGFKCVQVSWNPSVELHRLQPGGML